MYNDNSKAKVHNTFNRSVYHRVNKCNFIPNCAYETEHKKEVFPNGSYVTIYKSDNGHYMRAVYWPCSAAVTGIAGILFNAKTGEIVWCEVNPCDRNKGIYKQLRAVVPLMIKIKLWSQHHTDLMINTMHC